MIAIVRQMLVVVCMVIVSAVIVEAAAPAPDLAMLVEEAYQNNQELLSMTENAQALRAEAPFAGSLQDPVVGVSVANLPVDSFAFDQEPMTQKQLFASQKFPWFGTLDLRQQVSQLKAMEAEYQVRSRRLEIAKELAGAWYDLGYTIKSLEINEKLKALVTQMLRVAETRYATGEGLQQDILAGQVQHSELIDEGVNLASREQVIRTQIGSLLNRGQFFDHIGPLVLDEPGKLPDRGLLNRAALQSNPLVQQKKVARDRAKVEVQLAEKAYLPDFNVQLSYGQREDRPDFLSASVAMTVPLWQSTSQDSKLAAAKKRFAAAQKSLLGLSRTLPQSIDRVLAEIAGARENYSLFNEALSVQAAQLADASLAAYSVGKVEFNTMLAARIRLMRFQLKAENYKSQIYKKQAELEEIVGTRLSSLEGVQ